MANPKNLIRALIVFAALATLQADVIKVIKDVTLGFGAALEKCREESELTEEKMEEFFHFWHEDFKFEHREVGCAIQCMSKNYNLLTDSNRMHHDNTEAFIKSFPNGELIAQKMVQIIHTCEQQHDSKEDHCWRILHIAECFKAACVKAGIAPTMELVIAELIMEAEP